MRINSYIENLDLQRLPFMQFLEEPKQIKRTISYGRHEERVLTMEDYLMDHYGYDRSQLHKVLVRERYHQIRMV